jgi:hypothetical protein
MTKRGPLSGAKRSMNRPGTTKPVAPMSPRVKVEGSKPEVVTVAAGEPRARFLAKHAPAPGGHDSRG